MSAPTATANSVNAMPATTPCAAAGHAWCSTPACSARGAGSRPARDGITHRARIAGICTTGAIANAAIPSPMSASAARRNASAASAQAAANRYASANISMRFDGRSSVTSDRSGTSQNDQSSAGGRPWAATKTTTCWLKNVPNDHSA